MRSMILTGCLFLAAICAHGQEANRVASGTPLRWGMDGSVEVMEGDLARHYGSNDTANTFLRTIGAPANAVTTNPRTNSFTNVNAQCQNNAMTVNWVALQRNGADRYELEQSTDGNNWNVVGVVMANQTDFGEAQYNFTYNKDVSNVLFRIAATNTGGEKTYSANFGSPCSNATYLGITPNPAYGPTTVRVGSPGTARVKVLVTSANGTPMFSTDATLTAGINQVPVDLSSYPIGYYNVVLRWNNGRQEVLQVVKQ